jgi:hypothetical protein
MGLWETKRESVEIKLISNITVPLKVFGFLISWQTWTHAGLSWSNKLHMLSVLKAW